MLGLSFDKLLIIGVIAAFIIGPQRLPLYAARLARLARTLTDFVEDAKKKATDEVPELADVDWAKLDPRRYDPRRIVREALAENDLSVPRNDNATGGEGDRQEGKL